MKEKTKRELKIILGFIVEVYTFILTGIFAAYDSWFAIIIFVVGLVLAVSVGNRIAKNAELNFKINN